MTLAEPAHTFSPIDNELPLRWLRRLHLVPRKGLGIVRRALFLTAVAWLPLVVWAALTGRLVASTTGEPLLQHFGIHVRTMIAVPLFVLAEGMLHALLRRTAAEFVTSGIVPPAEVGAFDALLREMRRVRDSSLPWVIVLGVTVAWLVIQRPVVRDDTLAWAEAADGTLGFGGWWFAYVGRPIFLALLLAWLWRILLITYCFWRIGRLQLALVPSHPDRMGGLGFVQKVPGAYALVTLAMSAALCSRWAHEIAYHGATLESFQRPAIFFVLGWMLLALLPLLALVPPLWRVRKEALPAYGALVGRQGRLVHQRWILDEKIADDAVLSAPEIGPVADAASMYDAVERMRIVPIGKVALFEVALPLALPMIIVAALQIPVGEMLLKVVKTVL